jgi:hypothetical protein
MSNQRKRGVLSAFAARRIFGRSKASRHIGRRVTYVLYPPLPGHDVPVADWVWDERGRRIAGCCEVSATGIIPVEGVTQ